MEVCGAFQWLWCALDRYGGLEVASRSPLVLLLAPQMTKRFEVTRCFFLHFTILAWYFDSVYIMSSLLADNGGLYFSLTIKIFSFVSQFFFKKTWIKKFRSYHVFLKYRWNFHLLIEVEFIYKWIGSSIQNMGDHANMWLQHNIWRCQSGILQTLFIFKQI